MRTRFLAAAIALSTLTLNASVHIHTSPDATPREQYAAHRLEAATRDLHTDADIYLGVRDNPSLARFDKQLGTFWPDAKEAFLLARYGNNIVVAGYDTSGVLYGALELEDRIRTAHALPATLDYEDHPALKLRGTCIGMQKTEITYEGAEYDYPYTPENFPFFYDKAAWTRYLDMLVNERINTLYLWNGHPFSSLLKLPKYPEARELPEAQLDQNIAMFRWLTAEADRRGIWVLQGFYNIHLSHAFARAHHIPFHLITPTPEATAYTRYAISEFIREYPNVGLMMTLGEALSPHRGADWLTTAIIPGVKDGLAQLHTTTQPPIVVRAHATDIADVLKAANPAYSNIDTMFKWNGESLTWTNVRGPVLDRFKLLAENSNITVANIHLLSNLEPFRWGDPDFIRQTIANFQRIGIGGVHVYPLRYWDWPVSADKTDPLLQQTDRDWIWFAAWGRYAWNPNRNPKTEQAYWAQQFAERFGTPAAGEALLRAYTLFGPCAPRLLARIGITEGNRQAFSLGMTMPELIDAKRYNPAETLWTGDAPNGERLDDFVAKEVHGEPHTGETPIAVADESAEASAQALAAAESAGPGITKNRAEHDRILNDLRCIHALMLYYQAKTHAAEHVLLYTYDRKLDHLTQADTLLKQSVDHFAELTRLTDAAYRNAAGMQTSQRQIPVRGGPKTNHWRDLLPIYQRELTTFEARLADLQHGATATGKTPRAEALPQVAFTLKPGSDAQTFQLKPGEALATGNRAPTIAALAPELAGLTAIRTGAEANGPIHFTLSAPAQVLVGFYKRGGRSGPDNADAESWNPVVFNAVTAANGAPLTAWALPLAAGDNDLDLGKGAGVILGFVPQDLHIQPHAAPTNSNDRPNLDWMFEN